MQRPLLIARKWEDTEHAYHAPPIAWLGELVACACGHGIGRHAPGGCRGYYRRRCECSQNPAEVLEGAIRDARIECALE